MLLDQSQAATFWNGVREQTDPYFANDPPLWQDDKTFGCVGALDDFQFPAPDQSDRGCRRLPLITAVGEDLVDEVVDLVLGKA